MTCRTDSYRLSRWNAGQWFTRREGIMPCLGHRCSYGFCGLADDELPPEGSPCLWEAAFAARLLRQFDEMLSLDGIGRYLDDYLGRRKEWVTSHLLANRASVRASLALRNGFDAFSNRGDRPYDRRPFHEYDVARRYRTTARNRVENLYNQLPVIQERIRHERIVCLMAAHGHWKPGGAPPSVEDAPAWILERVNRR